jgi:hypothetical protein
MHDRARTPASIFAPIAALVITVVMAGSWLPSTTARAGSTAPGPGPAAAEAAGLPTDGHAEGEEPHEHLDLRNAQIAPEVVPGSAAADARAYTKPGWLPFRGSQRLGCVTTNCNGGGHALPAMDIAFSMNDPIYATGSGRVYLTVTNQGGNCDQASHPTLYTCPNGAQGNVVLIDHGDNVYSFYGHVNKVAVRPGQMVTDGTIIASAGNSGWTSPQFVHLHYEEWVGLTWAGGVRTLPRPLKGCHASTQATYPNVAGSTSWNGLPGFGVSLRHDGRCNANGPNCITGFYDVPGTHQFCTPISWMVRSDITNGFSDNLYHPTRVVSRQSAVAWLYRLAGSPGGTFPSPGLSDVPTSHPYRREISWAVSEGIVDGYADGTFRGTAPVTRAAFVAYLHRMAGSPRGPFPDPGLTDVTRAQPFYLEISWAVHETIAKGYSDDTFRRGDRISRQAGSTFLYRFDREGF